MHGKQLGKMLVVIIALSAALHLVWENAQAPLYVGYQNFWQHFWICLSVIPGDVAITVAAYFAVAFWRRNMAFAAAVRFSDGLAVGLIATLVSAIIERYSLASGRWAYGPAMPVLPVLQIGLLPVLQMMIIPPATLYLAGKSMRKNA